MQCRCDNGAIVIYLWSPIIKYSYSTHDCTHVSGRKILSIDTIISVSDWRIGFRAATDCYNIMIHLSFMRYWITQSNNHYRKGDDHAYHDV